MSLPASVESRYIIRVPGVCDGRPIVKGTRITVRAIVAYYKMGLSVEEILEGLPHLTPAQVYDALSYYHDHSSEIEQDIKENRLESLTEKYGLEVADTGVISARSGNGY